MEERDEIDGLTTSCLRRTESYSAISNSTAHDQSQSSTDLSSVDRKINPELDATDEFYDTDYEFNGYMVMFVHSKFDFGNYGNRNAFRDKKMLQKSFHALHFEVDVCEDYNLVQIERKMEELTSMDFSQYASLVVAVSSHGEFEQIAALDCLYNPNEILYDPIESISGLVGKPKIFLIEACRGYRMDTGISLMSVQTDGISDHTVTIPRQADFLKAFGSPEGYLQFHNKDHGSYFFIFLTETLDQFGTQYDLLKILTITNRKISVEFESKSNKEKYNGKKQCLCFQSTLRKQVLFRAKEKSCSSNGDI